MAVLQMRKLRLRKVRVRLESFAEPGFWTRSVFLPCRAVSNHSSWVAELGYCFCCKLRNRHPD